MLSEASKKKIRDLAGTMSVRQIAEVVGCSHGTVQNLVGKKEGAETKKDRTKKPSRKKKQKRPALPKDPSPPTLDPTELRREDWLWCENEVRKLRASAQHYREQGDLSKYGAALRLERQASAAARELRPLPPPDPAKDAGIRQAARALMRDVALTVRALEENALPMESAPRIDATLLATNG